MVEAYRGGVVGGVVARKNTIITISDILDTDSIGGEMFHGLDPADPVVFPRYSRLRSTQQSPPNKLIDMPTATHMGPSRWRVDHKQWLLGNSRSMGFTAAILLGSNRAVYRPQLVGEIHGQLCQ